MFNSTQESLLANLICQYDYYVAYYYGNYYDYQVGETRDYKIQVLCSDVAPVVENGVFSFSDCSYYEVTSNKYIQITSGIEKSFSPLGSQDIVYTNCIDGYPQLAYTVSTVRQDAAPFVMYAALVIFALYVIVRVIFGGK